MQYEGTPLCEIGSIPYCNLTFLCVHAGAQLQLRMGVARGRRVKGGTAPINASTIRYVYI